MGVGEKGAEGYEKFGMLLAITYAENKIKTFLQEVRR